MSRKYSSRSSPITPRSIRMMALAASRMELALRRNSTKRRFRVNISRSIAGEGDCDGITRRFRLFTCAATWPKNRGSNRSRWKSLAATVSEIREHWGVTRKHAVPFLEFFDQQEVTIRDGDVRTAGPRLALPLDEIVT